MTHFELILLNSLLLQLEIRPVPADKYQNSLAFVLLLPAISFAFVESLSHVILMGSNATLEQFDYDFDVALHLS